MPGCMRRPGHVFPAGSRGLRRPALLAVSLVAYGNAAAFVLGTAVPLGGWPGVVVGGLLLAIVLLWGHLTDQLSAAEIGLPRRRLSGVRAWDALQRVVYAQQPWQGRCRARLAVSEIRHLANRTLLKTPIRRRRNAN